MFVRKENYPGYAHWLVIDSLLGDYLWFHSQIHPSSHLVLKHRDGKGENSHFEVSGVQKPVNDDVVVASICIRPELN